MAIHSSILPGEFHGQRSLAGYSPCNLEESELAVLGLLCCTWAFSGCGECGLLLAVVLRLLVVVASLVGGCRL